MILIKAVVGLLEEMSSQLKKNTFTLGSAKTTGKTRVNFVNFCELWIVS